LGWGETTLSWGETTWGETTCFHSFPLHDLNYKQTKGIKQQNLQAAFVGMKQTPQFGLVFLLSSAFCPMERSTNTSTYIILATKDQSLETRMLEFTGQLRNVFTHVLYQKNESLIYSSSQ